MTKGCCPERETAVKRLWLRADSCPCVEAGVNRVTSNLWHQRQCGVLGALSFTQTSCISQV
jgi:hypothetical protein